MCRSTPRSTIELPMDPQAASLARDFLVAAMCVEHAMPVLEDAMLLTSEVVTNAVLHGGPPVVLAVDCVVSGMEIRVRDGTLAVPVVRNSDQTAESGRGLMLVDLLSDAWGVDPAPSGKETWFVIKPS